MTTQLVIVGAGASGLMAAVHAAECGLKPILLERRHRPGLKLLMCGNNRCNLSSRLTSEEMLTNIGEPCAGFLRPALSKFGPDELCRWFKQRGLNTRVHQDGRIFPASEKAADVLHFFTDRLRDLGVPLMLNAPVESVVPHGKKLLVKSTNFSMETDFVLLATGGVSYPKTGSVGDGQKFARNLGHRVTPFRPGLVGIEVREQWLQQRAECSFPGTELTLFSAKLPVARTRGEILTQRWGLVGPAILNASRIMAREKLHNVHFEIDLLPNMSCSDLAATLRSRGSKGLGSALKALGLPMECMQDFCRDVLDADSRRPVPADRAEDWARRLKNWHLHPTGTRPLKEAIVTVGGVSLEDVRRDTMASDHCLGLYFSGEVLDVDGPTGGYNLTAAFSTARLAIDDMVRITGATPLAPVKMAAKKPYKGNKGGYHKKGGRKPQRRRSR